MASGGKSSKRQVAGWKNVMMDRALTLHKVNSVSIPGIPHGPLNTARNDP